MTLTSLCSKTQGKPSEKESELKKQGVDKEKDKKPMAAIK
jgi:hypothetical protein